MRHLRTVLATPSPLERYQASRTRRAVEGDVVLLEVGPEDARRRHVIVLGAVAPGEMFARARAFYGGERIGSVELVAEHAAAVEEELWRRGWRVTEEEPALVMERAPATLPAPPADLTMVIPVTDGPEATAAGAPLLPARRRRTPALQPCHRGAVEPHAWSRRHQGPTRPQNRHAHVGETCRRPVRPGGAATMAPATIDRRTIQRLHSWC